MQHIPDTSMIGHLKWTEDGTIWATWRLEGLPKGLGGSDLNETRRRVHRALAQGIIGEYMLLGLGGIVSPDDIANKMLDGIDASKHPLLVEEVMLTMDEFDQSPHGRREFWISAPLKARTPLDKLRKVWQWAEHYVLEQVAFRRTPPLPDAVVSALRAAKLVEDQLPGMLSPRRATTEEQIWIGAHAIARGLYDDPAPERRSDVVTRGARQIVIDEHLEQVTTPKSYPPVLLDEGGQSDTTKKLDHINPLRTRFLKVQNMRTKETSYQSLLALSGTPKGGWHEDLDWVGALDELGVNADWVFRVQSISARDAKQQNARIEANINDQAEQREGTAAITGTGGEVDEGARDLNDFHQDLGRYDREVQVQATFIVAIGDMTSDGAIARAEYVQKYFDSSLNFKFDIPIGEQENLWWAMWPGVPTTSIVRQFAEITTGAHFATLAPLTSTELGDGKGILFADNIANGTERPVLLNLAGQIAGDVSGSIAIVGEPGGGKSVATKIILGGVHDRGGRFVAVDSTKVKEYAKFAQSLDPSSTAVCSLTDPEYTLDPLRVYGPQIGSAVMLTLLMALLGVSTRSDEGIMLANVLKSSRAKENGLVSIGALHKLLQSMAHGGDAIAKRLSGLMDVYSDTEYGAVLFNDSLEPLPLEARGIVFLTHGTALPSKDELTNIQQFDAMGLDKMFGNAMYALISRLSREICFGNEKELALLAIDEFEHFAASPHCLHEADWFVRHGRKQFAPVLLATQAAEDLGSDFIREQIKNRILTRQTDINAAQRNLEWFRKGYGKSPENVALVTEGLSPLGADTKVPVNRRGEALFSDARGRVGKIRTRVSRRPERALATLSTPEEEKVAA